MAYTVEHNITSDMILIYINKRTECEPLQFVSSREQSREPRSNSPADKNSSGRNLRQAKTPQAEASGKCSSIFFAPPLQIKLCGPSQ